MELTKRLRLSQIEIIKDYFGGDKPYQYILGDPVVARTSFGAIGYGRASWIKADAEFGEKFGIPLDPSVANHELEFKFGQKMGRAENS